MKFWIQRKIPLFALAVCVSFAVVFTEVVAAAHLEPECIGISADCPNYLGVKAAADFLDTLQLAVLFFPFSVFLLFLTQTLVIIKEFIPPRLSLIALKVRQDT